MSTKPMKVGALFAGYQDGGIEMGLAEVLDVEAAWFAEFDDAPSRILAHRWPDVPNLGDVTRVDWSAVEPVDVITGGSPCQDLSHAGKRAGMKAGTRSGLWASMCDAIDIIRPRLVVWENVRGALSAEADSGLESCPGCVGGGDDGPVLRALGRVLGDLAELGYDAAWTGLRAADVGAPHGRFRVFVLAWPADSAVEPWGERDGDDLRTRRGADGRPPDTGASDAPADPASLGRERRRPPRDGGPGPADSGAGPLALLTTPAVNDMGRAYTPETWDAWTARMKAAHGNGNGHGPSLHIEALRLLPTPTAQAAKHAADDRGPGTLDDANLWSVAARIHEAKPQSSPWGDYAPAIARWETVLVRPAPAPTEPTGKGGAHRLSADFTEWLMGLPAGWTDVPGVSRNDRLKALGNGVVPQQCAAAVRHLLDVRAGALEVAA